MGTLRTQAELDALFADNDTRSISPARLRDFVESCVPSVGTLSYATAATAIAAAGAFVKAGNVTVLALDKRFSMPAVNRLRYDGVADAIAHVTASLGVSAAAGAQLVAVGVAKNGVVIDDSVQRLVLGGAGELSHVSLTVDVDLATNDYLEVFVANETSDEDITIDHGAVRAIAFLT